MYSQHGEDDLIFKYIPKKDFGYYIDLGAAHPKDISNTYMLYEIGWKGLLVEPSPVFTSDLKTMRSKDIIFEGAVLDYIGTVKICSKGKYSVTEKSWIYDSHYQAGVDAGITMKEWTVPCTTLPTLLEQHPEFYGADFMSVDIDGNEEHVLKTLDFNKFNCKMILIEYGLRRFDGRKQWGHYLEPFYRVVFDNGSDCFYLRNDK